MQTDAAAGKNSKLQNLNMQLKKFKKIKVPVKYLPQEEWAVLNINSRNEYAISTMGRVYSFTADRLLKGKLCCGVRALEYAPANKKVLGNYVRTGEKRKLPKNGRLTESFQQLVAQTFLVKPKAKGFYMVTHKNYDKTDNRVSNLAYVRTDRQIHHSMGSPRFKRSKSSSIKLTDADVLKLKDMLKQKRQGKISLTMKQLGKKFHITDMQVYRIQNGDCFSSIGEVIKPKAVYFP